MQDCIVGVTGHRSLVDVPKVTSGIERALAVVCDAAPDRQLVVMSSLAEGADRLVANIGVESFHARLVATLPLGRRDFAADFHTAESKEEFERLLSLADREIEMPLAGDRRERFEAAGRYIVESCNVLLAVWDGQDARSRGGTGDIVRYARDLAKLVVIVRAQNGNRPVSERDSLSVPDGTVIADGLSVLGGG